MLISIEELKKMNEFSNIDENVLKRKIKAIEIAIRKYTNNNFQNRLKRIYASSSNGKLNGTCEYFAVGDTIQITESINNGLHIITAISEDSITFEEILFTEKYNLATKVEYPADIVEGALKLLSWEITNADKTGIASETISRHSVTYQNLDGANTIGGYPASLFGFCNKYMKARF